MIPTSKASQWKTTLKRKQPTTSHVPGDVQPTGRQAKHARPRKSIQQWDVKYAPQTEEELCIHPKKLRDIKEFLRINLDHSTSKQSILLLTGPPGAGKSTMVKVLSRSMGFNVIEWSDPTVKAFNTQLLPTQHKSAIDVFVPYEGRLKQLRDFFLRAKKYCQLPLSTQQPGGAAPTQTTKQVILIEELPYVGKADLKREFMQTIQLALNSAKFLVVFIITNHHETTTDLYKYFDTSVLHHRRVAEISVNPVTKRAIMTTFKKIAACEKLLMTQSQLERIADAAKNDIRSAVLSLQFETQSASAGDVSMARSRSVTRPKARKKLSRSLSAASKPKSSAQPFAGGLASRDDKFSTFHAVGKLLMAKETETRSVEEIVAQADLSPINVVSYLHHNGLDMVGDSVDLLSDLATAYSDADVLFFGSMGKYGDSQHAVPEALGSSVACRSYIRVRRSQSSEVSKQLKVKRGFTSITASPDDKVRRSAETQRVNVQAAGMTRLMYRDTFTLHLPFFKSIAQRVPTGVVASAKQEALLASLCHYSEKYSSAPVRLIERVHVNPEPEVEAEARRLAFADEIEDSE